MPKDTYEITKYADIFKVVSPSAKSQAIALILVGILTGTVASLVIHFNASSDPFSIASLGSATGIMIISMPAIISSILIKIYKPRMTMNRALLPVLFITIIYAAEIMIMAILYLFTKSEAIAYVVLLLSNASIYEYWFFVNKVAVGQRRAALFTAAIQPMLNIMFFLPFGGYILDISLPINTILIKLYFGTLVFIIVGYAIIYLVDRPAKKKLDISATELFTAMVSQWLYNIKEEASVFRKGGVKRKIKMRMLVLKNKGGISAIFVNPGIHYGPFSNVGGSVTTERIGDFVKRHYNATPFIVHGAVNISDNPVSASQISGMCRTISSNISSIKDTDFAATAGMITKGQSGKCKAINIRMNDTSLITLTKAPMVTEDIAREAGEEIESIVPKRINPILIDAHNSRFETAPKNELVGVYKGSRYVQHYKNAILESMNHNGPMTKLRFGSSSKKLRQALKGNQDMGYGYTSVGIFETKSSKFCMIYFDANNMLPGFREKVISHVRNKYGMEPELYTTDTHAVNSIALSASNALGRTTKPSEIFPIIDNLIEDAQKNMAEVRSAFREFYIENFAVWGDDAADKIVEVIQDINRKSRRMIPVLIAAAFIIAAWVIYVV